tara:strand:+ start:108 stop:416 length:309 start_codon:yes stop_codon:yes gene_type:complete
MENAWKFSDTVNRFGTNAAVVTGLDHTFVNINLTIFAFETKEAFTLIIIQGSVVYVQNLTTGSTILTGGWIAHVVHDFTILAFPSKMAFAVVIPECYRVVRG